MLNFFVLGYRIAAHPGEVRGVMVASKFHTVAFELGSAITAMADSRVQVILFSLALGGILAGFEFIVHQLVAAAQLPRIAAQYFRVDGALFCRFCCPRAGGLC